MKLFDFFKSSVEKLKEERKVKGLIEALRDKDKTIRKKAAAALGKLGDTRAITSLIWALKDKNLNVAEKAAEACRPKVHYCDLTIALSISLAVIIPTGRP